MTFASRRLKDTAPLGVSLAVLAVLVYFAIACGGDDKAGDSDVPVSKGELTFKAGEIKYEGVEEADARKLGDYFVEDGYFDDKPKSVELKKKADAWLVRLVVNDDAPGDPEYTQLLPLFGMQIANRVFGGDKVTIELCNDRFVTKATFEAMEGQKVDASGAELYYTSATDKATAEKFAARLVDMGIFSGQPVLMRLDRASGAWLVQVIMPAGITGTPEQLGTYRMLGLGFSEAFDGEPVKILLTNDSLVNQHEVECPNGKRLEFNGGELFYTPEIDEELATKLGEFLVKDKFFDGTPKSVRVLKLDGNFAVQMIVNAEAQADKKYIKAVEKFAKTLSKKVFSKDKVEIHLCDPTFTTQKVI